MTPEEVKNLKLKLELRKRKAAQEGATKPPPSDGYQPAAKSTPEMSTEQKFQNMFRNIPGSATNFVQELGELDIPTIAEAIKGTAKGADDLIMMRDSPESTGLKKMGEDVLWGILNPLTALSNDPIGVGSNFLGGFGALGKTAKVVEETTDLAKIVKDAELAKDTIYAENTGKFAGTDISNVPDAVKEAAKTARYHPKDHADLIGLGEIINRAGKSDPWIADLTEVSRLRGNMEKIEGGGRAPDSGLIGKSKDAFDEAVRVANPDMADALEAERIAYQTYKNTRGLADMLTSGKLKGAIRGDDANQVKRNIIRTLTNARTKKGYEDLSEELDNIVKGTANNPTVLGNFISHAPAGAAIGATIGGWVGLPGLGAAAGSYAPQILRGIRNTEANFAVDKEMLKLIRELNGLPPAKRHIRMQQLSPAKRAALIALGIGAQEE